MKIFYANHTQPSMCQNIKKEMILHPTSNPGACLAGRLWVGVVFCCVPLLWACGGNALASSAAAGWSAQTSGSSQTLAWCERSAVGQLQVISGSEKKVFITFEIWIFIFPKLDSWIRYMSPLFTPRSHARHVYDGCAHFYFTSSGLCTSLSPLLIVMALRAVFVALRAIEARENICVKVVGNTERMWDARRGLKS